MSRFNYRKVTKTQESITHKRAKRSTFSRQVTTSKINMKINYKKDPQKKQRLGTVEVLNMFNGANLTFSSDVCQSHMGK